MKLDKFLTYLILLIVAAGCGDSDKQNQPFEVIKSMNDMGDETELLKLAQQGDTNAFDKLSIAYLDYPIGDFLPIAEEMAEKYDYPTAYYEIYHTVLDKAGIYLDEEITSPKDESIKYAIESIVKGAKRGHPHCKTEILNYFAKGKLHYKQMININSLELQKKYIDSLSKSFRVELIQGVWAETKNSNSLFSINQDTIIYTEGMESYQYKLSNDTITIEYNDWQYRGILSYQDYDALFIDNIDDDEKLNLIKLK